MGASRADQQKSQQSKKAFCSTVSHKRPPLSKPALFLKSLHFHRALLQTFAAFAGEQREGDSFYSWMIRFLLSCPFLLQIICFSRCFGINLHHFISVFCSLSDSKREKDYLIPTCFRNKSLLWICTWDRKTDFHSQPVLSRYLKVIAQSRDISLS